MKTRWIARLTVGLAALVASLSLRTAPLADDLGSSAPPRPATSDAPVVPAAERSGAPAASASPALTAGAAPTPAAALPLSAGAPTPAAGPAITGLPALAAAPAVP